jgi:cytochrome P450
MNSRKRTVVSPTIGFSTEMGSNPETRAKWYRDMQKRQPIRYRKDSGIWEVFRYDDVQRVLTDHAFFSVEFARMEGLADDEPISAIDPPRHRQIRSLVSQAFTPRRVASLATRIRSLVDGLLDQVIATGKVDLAQQFAFPFPIMVIAEMLGIPPEEHELFRRWSYQLLGILPHPDDPENSEMKNYLSAQLDERSKAPHDDLISALVQAEVDGERLSRKQVVAICQGLLTAGSFTTTLLLTHAFFRFDKQPEIFSDLRSDLTLIPEALEEVLRYEFSFAHLARLVKHDMTFLGQELKAGEIILAWAGAANFDEAYFPDAERFDIRRHPNPHLSFGHGIHFCLGAPLARLEGKIALERILERMENIQVDPDGTVEYLDRRLDLISRLPLLFTPVA